MMHHWDDGWGVGNWLLMGVGMLLFWTLVVAGIIWLVRSAAKERRTSDAGSVSMDKSAVLPAPTARDVLDERYARGEINDDEYRARRDALAAR
ncbi:MAG: SHOCT domain-containing protein [Pseudonocardiales bacterium]